MFADFAPRIVETSLAVSALIALVLLLRRAVARRFGAEAAYLLWLAPLIRLFAPEFAILPAPAPAQLYATIAPVEVASISSAEPVVSPDIAMALMIVWAVGGVLYLAFQLFADRCYRARLMAGSAPASPAIIDAANGAMPERLAALPDIRLAATDAGPLVTGLFRPVIFLPRRFETAFTPVEQRLALAHELSHVARGDLYARSAALVFRAAQWPNPLAHLAWRAFRTDQEAACDESVLKRHAATPGISFVYGQAILKAAAVGAGAEPALTMSDHLKERLMLMKSLKSTTGLGRALAALIVAGGLALSASYSYAAGPVKKETQTSIQVISVDKGETLRAGGSDKAAKIEVKVEDGKKTVRTFDRKGKLLTEDVYGPGDATPYDVVTIVSRDGAERTFDVSRPEMLAPDAPMPPGMMMEGDAMDGVMRDDDIAGAEKRIIIMGHGPDGQPLPPGAPPIADCAGGEPQTIETRNKRDDGKTEVRREIVCLVGAKDPATRAESLRRTIDRMEAEAAEEAAMREKMLAKLRAELAEAEKEAAKK